jgi:predicted dehydrogenase
VETQAFLIGSRGSAQLSQSPMGRHVTFLTDENYAMPAVSGLPMYVSEAGHFADVALGKAEPLATVYDGLNASKVIDAGEMSLRSGAAVQISL